MAIQVTRETMMRRVEEFKKLEGIIDGDYDYDFAVYDKTEDGESVYIVSELRIISDVDEFSYHEHLDRPHNYMMMFYAEGEDYDKYEYYFVDRATGTQIAEEIKSKIQVLN